MFRKEYKKDFNSVTPDINLIEKTKQRLNNNTAKKHSGIQKRFVAAAVAICILIGMGFMTSNLSKPAFAIVAFADGGGQIINIEENTQVILPFGKISKGDRDFYLDETGKKIYTYDVGFDFGAISVKGKNITAVKYTTEKGEFRLLNPIPQRQADTEGKEILTTYYEELGSKSFDVNWIPWDAINIISEDGTVDFKELPSDNVIVEVYFKNGEVMIKHLKLSFNNDGNLIAEISTK
ncbi:MAG: hypothetical protein ACOX8W_01780 [bacterium]|jgi:hypothetical protein